MFTWTWDEVINRYETIKRGRQGDAISKLAGCMAQMLPELRLAVEERFGDINPWLAMFTTELKVADSYIVNIACIDEEECKFMLTLTKNYQEVIEESEVHSSDVVARIMEYLERSTQLD